MNQQLGIVVALTREAYSIRDSNLVTGRPTELSSSCQLFISGMGKDPARQASQILIDTGCNHLISWGCCAALSSDLRQGDLIIPDTITATSTDTLSLQKLAPDTVQQFKQNDIHVINGHYADCDKILSTSNDKTALYNKTQAIAADMESYAIAETAIQHGLPCTIVRAVSDDINLALPETITRHVDQYGEIILPDFAFALLRHPLQITSLIKLGLGFNRALASLRTLSTILFDS